MKRPLAYITAPWSENEFENTENAAKYCRAVYDAGFSPICPTLFLPLFLRDEIPQEHKDCIDMAREYLRRARVLVVCGSTVDESVKNDIAVAERLRITATTLDGTLQSAVRHITFQHTAGTICIVGNALLRLRRQPVIGFALQKQRARCVRDFPRPAGACLAQ